MLVVLIVAAVFLISMLAYWLHDRLRGSFGASPRARIAVKQRVSLAKRPLVVIASFAVVGAAALVFSRAATPTASLQADNGSQSGPLSTVTSSSASGGSAVKFGGNGVRRFFADDASWNKTIAQMGGEFTELKPFANRIWDYGGGTANGSPPGNFYLDFKDYSVPIYDMSTATTTVKAFQVIWSQNQQGFSLSGRMHIGDTIPWNPDWKPGTGNDRIMDVVNYQTGKVYGFWAVGEPASGCDDHNIFGIAAFDGPNTKAGFNVNDSGQICIAALDTYDNLWTAKEGSTTVERGMGINKLALVTRAQEVATGNIRHALELTTSNPMFGAGLDTPGVIAPTANANGSDPLGLGMVSPKNDPLQPGAGTTKGFYLKPATRLEHEFGYTGKTLTFGGVTTTSPTDAERAKTNPSGMRFGLNLGPDIPSSEAAITAWLDSKNYTGAKRTTAATFARAWRDYGAIIGETGGYGIGIETDGIIGGAANPAVAVWARLGITDDGTSTQSINTIDFGGLITRDRLYVVKPPQ